MNIGFDLDKIFINHPPFVPTWIITKLYGEKTNGTLSYRIPGKLEQAIRKLSHASFLRPAIETNIQILKNMKKDKEKKFFLISSRFSFLKKETEKIVTQYGLRNIFSAMDFNFTDKQPHIFKNEIIKKRKIQRYVDDDLPLLLFLASKHPRVLFFWLNQKRDVKLQSNVYAITHLTSVFVPYD